MFVVVLFGVLLWKGGGGQNCIINCNVYQPLFACTLTCLLTHYQIKLNSKIHMVISLVILNQITRHILWYVSFFHWWVNVNDNPHAVVKLIANVYFLIATNEDLLQIKILSSVCVCKLHVLLFTMLNKVLSDLHLSQEIFLYFFLL